MCIPYYTSCKSATTNTMVKIQALPSIPRLLSLPPPPPPPPTPAALTQKCGSAPGLSTSRKSVTTNTMVKMQAMPSAQWRKSQVAGTCKQQHVAKGLMSACVCL